MNRTQKVGWMQKMTKLQKDSLMNLIATTVAVLIGTVIFTIMQSRNTKGFDYIIILIIVGGICGLAGAIFIKKHYRYLDERQLLLCLKASRFSAITFVIYIVALSVLAFFVVGGKGKIQVYYIPIAAFIGLFLSQLVETLIVFFAEPVE